MVSSLTGATGGRRTSFSEADRRSTYSPRSLFLNDNDSTDLSSNSHSKTLKHVSVFRFCHILAYNLVFMCQGYPKIQWKNMGMEFTWGWWLGHIIHSNSHEIDGPSCGIKACCTRVIPISELCQIFWS